MIKLIYSIPKKNEIFTLKNVKTTETKTGKDY